MDLIMLEIMDDVKPINPLLVPKQASLDDRCCRLTYAWNIVMGSL